MHVRKFLPPQNPCPQDYEAAIFLAGPIQGAPDWQTHAHQIILEEYEGSYPLNVFSPRRPNNVDLKYEEQVAWEKRYLERARNFGALIFWFAKQDYSLPYEKDRAYAKTTRLELMRAVGWLDYASTVNIVVGKESGYEGDSQRYLDTVEKEHCIKVRTDLGELCLSALEKISSPLFSARQARRYLQSKDRF